MTLYNNHYKTNILKSPYTDVKIMNQGEIYKFFTDQVAFKSQNGPEGKKYYIEGYASTNDIDLVNDIVTKECMEDMAEQIKGKTIKIDVEHEAWKKNPDILPIGKCIDAKVDDKGLWIKCELNRHSPKFKAVWGSIKEGYLDAFSIAYQVKKKTERIINGVKARILEAVNLLNIALTGNPANPEARITAVIAKSLEAAESTEVELMAEEKEEPITTVEEKSTAVEEKAKDIAPEEETPEDDEELEVDIKSLKCELAELKNTIEALKNSNEELKIKLSAAVKALEKPLIKSHNEELKSLKPESKPITPLSMLR